MEVGCRRFILARYHDENGSFFDLYKLPASYLLPSASHFCNSSCFAIGFISTVFFRIGEQSAWLFRSMGETEQKGNAPEDDAAPGSPLSIVRYPLFPVHSSLSADNCPLSPVHCPRLRVSGHADPSLCRTLPVLCTFVEKKSKNSCKRGLVFSTNSCYNRIRLDLCPQKTINQNDKIMNCFYQIASKSFSFSIYTFA